MKSVESTLAGKATTHANLEVTHHYNWMILARFWKTCCCDVAVSNCFNLFGRITREV